ncbi:MAG: SAM-dependent methyltransferase [Nocardiopsaceae bacterium]|nr:SAM-dependent methyltransferase [Nocardiopsaceae bacterium]
MTSNEAPEHGGGRPGLPFDPGVAHQARMYDYMLGGSNNYAVDRAAADEMMRASPEQAFSARANRAFLGRAVRYLTAEAGIRQFLDIGTGIPTAGNIHEVAQAIAPETRVVYVDYDPLVLAYAKTLLASSEQGATNYIHADMRDTATVLTQAANLLDFTQPVAVTMLAILHAIPDSEDPYGIVATLMDAVPPGSYLAISHGAADLLDQEALDRLMDVTNRSVQQKGAPRTREQVARFFDGLDLVEPGLVRVGEWRPEPGPDWAGTSTWWCAVGRKRLSRAVIAMVAAAAAASAATQDDH